MFEHVLWNRPRSALTKQVLLLSRYLTFSIVQYYAFGKYLSLTAATNFKKGQKDLVSKALAKLLRMVQALTMTPVKPKCKQSLLSD